MGRRSTWDRRLAGAYVAGTTLGAIASALALWLVSGLTEPVPGPVRHVALGAGVLLVWAVKHGPLAGRARLPEARRQIPAEVFGGDLLRAAFRFGAELGTGARTYAPSAAPYVLGLALVLGRVELSTAVAAGAGFGVGRGLPLVVRAAVADRGRLFAASQRAVARLGASASTVLVAVGGFTIAS